MEDVFKILDNLKISYKKYEQKPVKTCAESTALLPDGMPGVRTKHLFLRDRKKKNYLVIVLDENKLVDLKQLSKKLDLKSLGMASEEELQEYLGVEIGALSMLSFLNDNEHKVQFLMDEAIWNEEAFDCHPNVSGIVLLINKEYWLKIFKYMNREPKIIAIPEKLL